MSTEPCNDKHGGFFCAKPAAHGGEHESCGGRRWGESRPRILSHDPHFGWEPAIPEPFWVRRRQRWLRRVWVPACYPCGIEFPDVYAYGAHYLRHHGVEGDAR